MATPAGIEPALSDVTGRRFNQLNYGAIWLREWDSNPRLLGYEPKLLTSASSRDVYSLD